MIRKQAFTQAGGFRELFVPTEDYDLWLRLSELADVANVPYYLLRYRVHFNNLSFQRTERQVLSILGARQAARLRRSGQPDPFNASSNLTWASLREIGCDHGELVSGVCRNLKGYLGWCVALGNFDLVLKLLKALLDPLKEEGVGGEAVDLLVWLVGELVLRKQVRLAIKCSLLALKLEPRMSLVLRLLDSAIWAIREKKHKLTLQVCRTPAPVLPECGYVDRITPIDTSGLVVEGWAPALAPIHDSSIRIYTNLPIIRAEIKRNARYDVAAARGGKLLKSGFVAVLEHTQAPEGPLDLSFTVVSPAGHYSLTMCRGALPNPSKSSSDKQPEPIGKSDGVPSPGAKSPTGRLAVPSAMLCQKSL
jgi:hypothetical protein